MKLRRGRRAFSARRAADAVVEQPAPGAQQALQPVEVLGQLRLADVLEHADRADGVVGAVGDLAVVLHPDLDAVGQPGVGHPLLGQLGLAAARS